MIIECPKCKSTFNISNGMEIKIFLILNAVSARTLGEINKNNDKTKITQRKNLANGYFYVVILNLVILILVIIALFILKKNFIHK